MKILFVIVKWPLAHTLETAKIKYLIYLQSRNTEQANKNFFANFGNYSKGHCFRVNGCQNTKLCFILEIWRQFESWSYK